MGIELSDCKTSKERKHRIKEAKKFFQKENKEYPLYGFKKVSFPDSMRNDICNGSHIICAFRSRNYLASIFNDNGYTRISVNMTDINENGEWLEGISWDILQHIKTLLGYGEFEAVEVYPKDSDVVNIANIRHLFILKENELPFIWRKNKA